MKIVCTLSYVLSNGNDWLAFCYEFGCGEYVCHYGYGDKTVALTKEQANSYGLL